jgi:glycosyltransferase involved in cell wall biosynthesis
VGGGVIITVSFGDALYQPTARLRPLLRQMRIAQVVETLEVGGLERMALDLAVEQTVAGHQVFIYCVVGEGPLAGEARTAGIPVRLFSKPPGISLRLPFQLAWRFWRDGIEVAHCHNPGVHPYTAAGARCAGVPVVINTRHGPATSFGIPYQERHFRLSLPLTDHVVFVSEQSRTFCVQRYGVPEARTSVILNGIRVDRFSTQPASPGALRPRIRFGTVGRMVPAKGHADLIEAFAQVVKLLPEAELRIAGGGPLHDSVEQQVRRLGLERCVHLEGQTSDVGGFLQELDVFVFSSINEGLPLSILEAMAAGLPIVSTRVGGVPEVAPEGEVAWFCPIGDPAALAGAMCEAALSGDLVKRGQRARELAVSGFHTSTMCRKYETLYRACLARY